MSHRVLVTGATGFIGSHLVRALVDAGWQPSVLARRNSDLSRLGELAGRVTVYRHEGSVTALTQFLQAQEIELVYHLPSCFTATHTAADLEPLVAGNILLATQLAEAMTACGCLRLVNTGTSWQHFHDEPYHPVCLYAATKQACEAILAYYASACGLQVINLKLFDSYGPNDTRPKLFSLFRRAEDAPAPIEMSPGEQLIDLVHVDDIVRAFLTAGGRLLSGQVTATETYGVSSGNPLPLRQLARLYEQASGRSLNVHWGGRAYRQREVMTPWSGGAPLPGWQPRVTLEAGIKQIRAESLSARAA